MSGKPKLHDKTCHCRRLNMIFWLGCVIKHVIFFVLCTVFFPHIVFSQHPRHLFRLDVFLLL